jgi:hypothetical protein
LINEKEPCISGVADKAHRCSISRALSVVLESMQRNESRFSASNTLQQDYGAMAVCRAGVCTCIVEATMD